MSASLPAPRAPLVSLDGLVSPEWYRYFAQFHHDFSGSETTPGSGLTLDNGDLGLADNGVTNAKLRDSLGVSVIGRPFDSTGNPQDIQASMDGAFLQRDADEVVFRLPKLASYTVATIPLASGQGAGTRIFVTDATVTTFASIVAGGGTNGVPCYSDGTNWRIG